MALRVAGEVGGRAVDFGQLGHGVTPCSGQARRTCVPHPAGPSGLVRSRKGDGGRTRRHAAPFVFLADRRNREFGLLTTVPDTVAERATGAVSQTGGKCLD